MLIKMGKLPKEVQKDLGEVSVRLLRWNWDIKEIWLFGSYARGDFHKQSDIDLAIFVEGAQYLYTSRRDYIEDKLIEWKDLSPAIQRIRDFVFEKSRFGRKYSPHIFTKDDWPYNYNDFGGRENFIQEVKKGTLIYKL